MSVSIETKNSKNDMHSYLIQSIRCGFIYFGFKRENNLVMKIGIVHVQIQSRCIPFLKWGSQLAVIYRLRTVANVYQCWCNLLKHQKTKQNKQYIYSARFSLYFQHVFCFGFWVLDVDLGSCVPFFAEKSVAWFGNNVDWFFDTKSQFTIWYLLFILWSIRFQSKTVHK